MYPLAVRVFLVENKKEKRRESVTQHTTEKKEKERKRKESKKREIKKYRQRQFLRKGSDRFSSVLFRRAPCHAATPSAAAPLHLPSTHVAPCRPPLFLRHPLCHPPKSLRSFSALVISNVVTCLALVFQLCIIV
jgi:hypothetical protein